MMQSIGWVMTTTPSQLMQLGDHSISRIGHANLMHQLQPQQIGTPRSSTYTLIQSIPYYQFSIVRLSMCNYNKEKFQSYFWTPSTLWRVYAVSQQSSSSIYLWDTLVMNQHFLYWMNHWICRVYPQFRHCCWWWNSRNMLAHQVTSFGYNCLLTWPIVRAKTSSYHIDGIKIPYMPKWVFASLGLFMHTQYCSGNRDIYYGILLLALITVSQKVLKKAPLPLSMISTCLFCYRMSINNP